MRPFFSPIVNSSFTALLATMLSAALSKRALLLLTAVGLPLSLFMPTLVLSIQERSHHLADFQYPIELQRLSDIQEKRVVFHSYRVTRKGGRWLKNSTDRRDSEQATLLVIAEENSYLLKDGYEDSIALAKRRRQYWKKFERWQKQRRMLAELSRLKKEKERKEPFLPKDHPDMIAIRNAAWQSLYQNDEELQSAVQNHRREEAQLLYIEKRHGDSSPEYRRQKQLAEESSRRAIEREEQLRSLAQWGMGQESQSAEESPSVESSSSGRPAARIAEPPTSQEKMAIYQNPINGRPDQVVIAARGERQPFIHQSDSPESDAVERRFGSFYRAVRDRHIQRYVNQYRSVILATKSGSGSVKTSRLPFSDLSCGGELLRSPNPGAAGISEDRDQPSALPPASPAALPNNLHYRVEVRSSDGAYYIAEDCNGDGITETFLVQESRGFHWGIADMPDALLIYNNHDPQVSALIADLVRWAIEGEPDSLDRLQKRQQQILESVNRDMEREERIGQQILSE